MAAVLVVVTVSLCLTILKAALEVLEVLDEATSMDRMIGTRTFSGMEALAPTMEMMMILSRAEISSRAVDHLNLEAMVDSTGLDLAGLEAGLDVEVTLLVCVEA